MSDICEERVIIDGENKIGATISYQDKEKKQPLVLLIMGTGKMDRDGNGFGFKSNFYKNLSDMFVNNGFVCVRYDKRGTHESTGDFGTAGLCDLVDDSASVIEYAKGLDYVDADKIIACGHSEGAIIATLLTQQEKLDRVILLGGACMSIKHAMEYQNLQVMEELNNMNGFMSWIAKKFVSKEKIDKQLTSFFDRAKNAKKDKFFFNGAFFPTKWVKEHGALTDEDFVEMIGAYNGKVLAITGQGDVQADYTCLDKIKEFENVTTYTPENVNHMLRENDRPASALNAKKEYKGLFKKPMHEGTIQVIEEFLEK